MKNILELLFEYWPNPAEIARGWFFLSFFLVSALAQAQPVDIALHKTYTFSPAPNYSLTSKDPNGTLLTDGKYTSDFFWTAQTTVGWSNVSPVSITFDLGSDQPIEGISYNTAAASGANVAWPQGIAVLVSDDKKTWYYAGDVVELNDNPAPPPPTSYTVYRYTTTKLQVHGRYVQLMITANPCIFVDEIQIFQGPSTLLSQVLPGAAITDLTSFYSNYLVNMHMHSRLYQDLNNVSQELASANLSTVISSPLNTTLQSILAQIPQSTIDSIATFKTIFPENDLHRQIFGVQAAIWRAMGLNTVVVSSANRWDPISPVNIPVAGSASMDVSMMSNEFRAGTLNLSNTEENPDNVSFSIEGLPGGTNPSYISVYEVPFTDTQAGNPVAAALMAVPVQNNLYIVSVPSGLTHQIWFSFNPTQVPAGDYSGTIKILIDGVTTSVPLHLKIYPLQFPAVPTLHIGGWDYTATGSYYATTDQNRNALIQTMSDHFVDTPWADGTNGVMPTGTYNADGSMHTPPSNTLFKNWITQWPKARNYCVFLNASTTFGGFAINTSAWQTAVTAWTQWWVNQLQAWNINPNQLVLLIVDEPSTQAQDNTIISYAKVIHAAALPVKIFEDPTWADPTQADPALFNDSNILSPNVGENWIPNATLSNGQSFDDFYVNQQNQGHDLWFYNTQGPTRSFDPYTYYLGQEWLAWKYGAKGSQFWSFTDAGEEAGGDSWDEYTLTSTVSYTPLFIDSASVTLGKHMEALREGVEDYEYLRMLRDEVNQLVVLGIQNSALTSSQELLTSAPDRMLAGMNTTTWEQWSTVKDRTVQDQIRVEILDALAQLNQIDPRNVAPTVTLTTDQNVYTVSGTAVLSATASAAPGATIKSVAFYNGTALLGTVTVSPYIYKWTQLVAGTYTLTAVVTDSNNNSTTSAAVNITVKTPYTLTVSTAGFGEVFSSDGNINCGVNAAPLPNSCSETVNAGTTITLTATPATGSVFSSWSGGGCSGTGSCVVTMNGANNVTATFGVQTQTITVNTGTGGTVSPVGAISVNYGASKTFTVTPTTGYSAQLLVDGTPVSLANNAYTLSDVIENHTLAASFSLQATTTTASAGTGGTINPSGSVTINYGANQTFNVTPDTGYIAHLKIDGKAVALTNGVYILKHVTTGHTAIARFTRQPETITVIAGPGGTITPSGSVIARYGRNKKFTITPNAGYSAKLTVDGSVVALTRKNTYTLKNITTVHTVEVSFKK